MVRVTLISLEAFYKSVGTGNSHLVLNKTFMSFISNSGTLTVYFDLLRFFYKLKMCHWLFHVWMYNVYLIVYVYLHICVYIYTEAKTNPIYGVTVDAIFLLGCVPFSNAQRNTPTLLLKRISSFQSPLSNALPGCLSYSWTWISVQIMGPLLHDAAPNLGNSFSPSVFYNSPVTAILTIYCRTFFPPSLILL